MFLNSRNFVPTKYVLDRAIELVHLTNAFLKNQVAQIRSHCNDLPATLNGPEGSISDKTLISLQLVEWGLRQLKSTLDLCQYKGLIMKTCNTINVNVNGLQVNVLTPQLWTLCYLSCIAIFGNFFLIIMYVIGKDPHI